MDTSLLYTELIVVERQIYTAQLMRAIQLSKQTRHLEFKVQDLPAFRFAPGQFLSLLAEKEGREITRAYSIASAPGGLHFDLCLNRVEEGFFSNLLCDMQEGETIRFHGPHGLFTLREPLKDSIFICTGTGVAPFRSYVQWLFQDPQRIEGREFWLIYGTRHEETIYYRQEFEKLSSSHPKFHYLPTLSRGRENWVGLRGYVQDQARRVILNLPEERRAGLQAYICGLNVMVKANRTLLTELGFEKKNILYERYD